MDVDLASHADWLRAALPPWPLNNALPVRCLVPAQYEAYARVMHPVQRRTDDGVWVPMRWADHIRQFGDVMVDGHPVEHLTNAGALSQPHRGCIDPWVLPHLAPLLSGDPYEPVIVGIWTGFGGLRPPRDTQRVAVPNREYALAVSPLREICRLGAYLAWPGLLPYSSELGPQVWWPRDRSWFVASDIDLEWTYVGGSERLIQAILDEPAFEATRVRPDDSIVDVPGVETPSMETS